jgi:hypothetical protein
MATISSVALVMVTLFEPADAKALHKERIKTPMMTPLFIYSLLFMLDNPLISFRGENRPQPGKLAKLEPTPQAKPSCIP